MLSVEDIGAWLASLGITDQVADGYWVPPNPDRIVLVSFTGGPGTSFERAFDRISFQVRCRGQQRQPSDALALAGQVDDAILGVVPPVTIGGRFVNDVDRVGSPPRWTGADKSLRSEYTAQYLLQIAR